VSSNYWKVRANRQEAIKYLFDLVIKETVEEVRKGNESARIYSWHYYFKNNGLGGLIRNYYNGSIAKAFQEAGIDVEVRRGPVPVYFRAEDAETALIAGIKNGTIVYSADISRALAAAIERFDIVVSLPSEPHKKHPLKKDTYIVHRFYGVGRVEDVSADDTMRRVTIKFALIDEPKIFDPKSLSGCYKRAAKKTFPRFSENVKLKEMLDELGELIINIVPAAPKNDQESYYSRLLRAIKYGNGDLKTFFDKLCRKVERRKLTELQIVSIAKARKNGDWKWGKHIVDASSVKYRSGNGSSIKQGPEILDVSEEPPASLSLPDDDVIRGLNIPYDRSVGCAAREEHDLGEILRRMAELGISDRAENMPYTEVIKRLEEIPWQFEISDEDIIFIKSVVGLLLKQQPQQIEADSFKGFIEKIINNLRREIEIKTGNLKLISETLIGLGRFEEIIERLKELLRMGIVDAEIYEYLGVAYAGLFQYDEAIGCFNKVLEIDPDHLDAYLSLATIYCSIGDYRNAYAAINMGFDLGMERSDIAMGNLEMLENLLDGFEHLVGGNFEDAIYRFSGELDRGNTLTMASKYRHLAYHVLFLK